jgi:hypothetical protein
VSGTSQELAGRRHHALHASHSSSYLPPTTPRIVARATSSWASGPPFSRLKWRVPETVALHASGTFASAWKEEPALRPTRRSSWTSRERPTDRLVRSPLRDERQRRLRSQPRCDDAEAGDNCLSRNLSRTPPTLSRSQPISHDLTRPERTPANGFRRILSPETRVRIPVAVPEAPAKRGFLRPGGVGPGRRTRSPAF